MSIDHFSIFDNLYEEATSRDGARTVQGHAVAKEIQADGD